MRLTAFFWRAGLCVLIEYNSVEHRGEGMNSVQNSGSGGAPNYKEMVRTEWTGAAPYWQKWNAKFVVQTRAATELVVRGAQAGAGMKVLDLACGTGEPALSLAKAVGASGRVVATDLVPEMLEFARQNALARELHNIEFRVADAEALPFEDGEFDRVTCRFGIMFFPEFGKAMAEIRRVLKRGGRICFAVFGTLEENPFFQVSLAPYLKRVKVQAPPPDAPHIFRFAEESKLAGALSAAGFLEVSASKNRVIFPWPGSAEESWEATRELAAPFKKLMKAIPREQADEVFGEVLDGLRRFQVGDEIQLAATVIIATGAC
jgi:ubiquinone/menaquinone biosynthesis C-methylase UbiE